MWSIIIFLLVAFVMLSDDCDGQFATTPLIHKSKRDKGVVIKKMRKARKYRSK